MLKPSLCPPNTFGGLFLQKKTLKLQKLQSDYKKVALK